MFFNTDPRTFYQAVMFGVVTVLLGLILSLVFGFLKPELSAECETWDKYYVMEITLFFIGFIMRYLLINSTVQQYLFST